MTFFQRLKRFLFGVAIGVILTGVFFKDRLSVFTSWLPANVIKNNIKDSSVFLSDKADCQFAAYALTMSDVDELLEEGKVDFSESQTKIKPYSYTIYSEDRKYTYVIEMRKEQSEILEISSDSFKPDCQN